MEGSRPKRGELSNIRPSGKAQGVILPRIIQHRANGTRDQKMQKFSEALKLLGFSTPFVYAVATYGVFHYLDRKASGKAKQTISAWFKPLAYGTAGVSLALVELFDRLYTTPLFGWRAMLRSFCLSIVMLIVFIYEFYTGPIDSYFFLRFPLFLIANAASDYLSLFIIRRWLAKGGQRPLFAILIGALIGVIIVIVTITFLAVIPSVLLIVSNAPLDLIAVYITRIPVGLIYLWKDFFVWAPDMGTKPYILSAFAVHLWLPLLGIALLCLRIVNWILWSVGKMQWFLKQGHLHPLDAIGYVAAVLVFVGTIAIRAAFG
jgi:hypothetical protein